jgi:GDSL-like Lipase/Acylhydrolase family
MRRPILVLVAATTAVAAALVFSAPAGGQLEPTPTTSMPSATPVPTTTPPVPTTTPPVPTTTPAPIDRDGDGVLDDSDRCLDSYPGYPVDDVGCGRPVELDWRVPDRFTGTPASTRAEVEHASYPATLIVKFPDGRPCDPSMGYQFLIEGNTLLHTGSCEVSAEFSTTGEHIVGVRVSAAGNHVTSSANPVRIKDLLIVSLGDSVASGEGNPPWRSTQCHRSMRSAPMIAARKLETDDERSSVTAVDLACSGASIYVGLLGGYAGIEPGNPLAPQVDAAEDLIGERTPDAVLLSVGANDLGFADILMDCLGPNDCARRQQARLTTELANLPEKYRNLAAALNAQLGGQIHITEYFTPLYDERNRYCRIFPGMSSQESEWAELNVVAGLNRAVSRAAVEHGWHYVGGIRDEFVGHGYCADATDRWIRNVWESLAQQGNTNGAFHPNEFGRRTYARHLRQALDHLIR